MGPNTVWPIAGQSKKHTCVSHSTPEAEIVSADHCVKTYGVPAIDLWSLLLSNPELVMDFHEDNATAVQVLKSGYSGAMRHLERTHGVCLRFLAERFRSPHFRIYYERSALEAADVYTKHFTNGAEWEHVCKLINHLQPAMFWAGRSGTLRPQMGCEHKGGVKFDYWTSNPWAAQDADRGIAAYVNGVADPARQSEGS